MQGSTFARSHSIAAQEQTANVKRKGNFFSRVRGDRERGREGERDWLQHSSFVRDRFSSPLISISYHFFAKHTLTLTFRESSYALRLMARMVRCDSWAYGENEERQSHSFPSATPLFSIIFSSSFWVRFWKHIFMTLGFFIITRLSLELLTSFGVVLCTHNDSMFITMCEHCVHRMRRIHMHKTQDTTIIIIIFLLSFLQSPTANACVQLNCTKQYICTARHSLEKKPQINALNKQERMNEKGLTFALRSKHVTT